MDIFDTSRAAEKLFEEGYIELTFTYPDDETLLKINALLTKILSKIDRIFLLDTIVTILRELMLNAAKANAKRVFFENNNYYITSKKSYEEGMGQFAKKVVTNISSIRDELEKSPYQIMFSVEMKERDLFLTVSGNVGILPIEFERIEDRLKLSMDCNSFSEAYESAYDPSEGAGLGIMLSVLLLKNAGMSIENYQISKKDGALYTTIHVPYNLRSHETTQLIESRIVQEVETLPTFPENVLEIQRLCDDPKSTIDSISDKISSDPSLAADVLKISNSAGFITGKKIQSIHKAIMVIGLKNLKEILTATSSRKILNKRYKKFEQVWNHCNRAAFIARKIAYALGKEKIAEKAFIGGLLHDIGKIVLLSTDIELVTLVSEIVKNRKIRSSAMLEEVSIGISHSAIGELIATKWNFPEYIVEAIRHHHSPLLGKEEYRDIVYIVYLADMLLGIDLYRYNYFLAEPEVLEAFGLEDEPRYISFAEKILDAYTKHSDAGLIFDI